MSTLLSVDNVTKQFVNHTALDDVSLSVSEGSIYGLLGPNGAGKTTLIRIINHITAPDSGSVTFMGRRLTHDSVSHIGYLPEERGLYKKMKVGEQAVFFARLKGMSRRDAVNSLKQWFEKFDIMPWWDKKVEELSKGMAQKVQFIITVLHRPELLIFDEPFSGFDPINADLLKNEILQLRDQGATIIFSTHNMASVETLCDDITLINRSRNILTGNVDQIRHAHGKDRYKFTIDGDPAQLISALQPMLSEAQPEVEQLRNGLNSISLKFVADTPVKDIIARANEASQLRGFNSDLPSMDEIFISAVNANNQSEI
ncbi:MAG: ATP-binding cassette domain-containing protein [Muribaculaceae bacterium]|nr:ATP-binding cassette domain-containing protein [Muribaculaceae bacterium]MDE5968475.1 ATP-binding cassette domain-containing protein [Muribaculaceae bacterium]MDE7393678.1 ATP-binding cassette domain-containing protein [Muribaculaceae bacterium]